MKKLAARRMTPSAGPLVANPAFLVGSERSGTTLLRLMLNQHPRISFHFEFEFAVELVREDGSLPDLAAFHDYLADHRIFQLSGACVDPGLDFRQLLNSFLVQHRGDRDSSVLGATVHQSFDRLPFLWPQGRYVHLIRDGRDVSLSIVAMGWAGNTWCAIDRWLEAERTWENLCRRVPAERRLDVYYEKLIADPEHTLTEVCRFLDLDFDAAMLTYPQHSTYELPDPSKIGQWRNTPPQQVRRAEAKACATLLAHGYELSGAPAKYPSFVTSIGLRLHDKWRRAMFRIKRYGLGLVLASAIARKLGPKSLARLVSKRISDIDNRNLR